MSIEPTKPSGGGDSADPSGTANPAEPETPNENPSDPEPSGQGGEGGGDDPSGKVSYESHKKLLDEKKKLAERLTAIEQEKKAHEEKTLKEQERWKEYAEMRDQELEQTRQELTKAQTREQNARKLDAFLGSLDGKVDKKYWGLIDINSIEVTDSGEVDEMSVTREVERFRKEHPILIEKPQKPGHDPSYPKGGSPALTKDQWKKLPLKERKERLHEVVNSR